MLMVSRLDRVQLNLTVQYDHWGVLAGQLYYMAEEACVKLNIINRHGIGGYSMDLMVSGQQLHIGMYYYKGHRWIAYRIKGSPDAHALEVATCPLGQYSFAHIGHAARFKALELASDISPAHTSDYLTHLVASKKSRFVSNDAGTGSTFYTGSRTSPIQLINYDKSQEMLDKKKKPEFAQAMRIELRIQNRSESVCETLQSLFVKDPFDRLIVVRRSAASKVSPNEKNWIYFLSIAGAVGVAKALRQFPSQRKLFLQRLDQAAQASMTPTIANFSAAITKLLPSLPMVKTSLSLAA